MNAHFRAREHLRPDAVLHDVHAALLADVHPVIRLLRLLERHVPSIARVATEQAAAHVVRHRSVDLLVEAALNDGFGQIVVVGAGYDSRAWRLPGAELATWYEVDRPEMAAIKVAKLGAARLDVDRVRRVPASVHTPAWLVDLERAGWNRHEPSCFVVEGLLHYLDQGRAEALLDELWAGPAPRRVLLSFIEPAMSRRVTPLYRELTRSFGEIPRTFFERETLGAKAAAAGRAWRSWDYQ